MSAPKEERKSHQRQQNAMRRSSAREQEDIEVEIVGSEAQHFMLHDTTNQTKSTNQMNHEGVIREEQSQQNLECVEEFDPFAGQVQRVSGNNYELMFGLPVNLKLDGQEQNRESTTPNGPGGEKERKQKVKAVKDFLGNLNSCKSAGSKKNKFSEWRKQK